MTRARARGRSVRRGGRIRYESTRLCPATPRVSKIRYIGREESWCVSSLPRPLRKLSPSTHNTHNSSLTVHESQPDGSIALAFLCSLAHARTLAHTHRTRCVTTRAASHAAGHPIMPFLCARVILVRACGADDEACACVAHAFSSVFSTHMSILSSMPALSAGGAPAMPPSL